MAKKKIDVSGLYKALGLGKAKPPASKPKKK